MKKYYTVYETGKFEFQVNFGYIICIIMVSLFTYIVINNFRHKKTLNGETLYKTVITERVMTILALTLTLCAFLFAIVANIIDYNFIKNSYHERNYNVVEGVVEEFIPMKFEGHSQESFIVEGIEFSYSRSNPIYGYHFPKVDGGFITGNGQYVKISYITYNEINIIVKLELLENKT